MTAFNFSWSLSISSYEYKMEHVKYTSTIPLIKLTHSTWSETIIKSFCDAVNKLCETPTVGTVEGLSLITSLAAQQQQRMYYSKTWYVINNNVHHQCYRFDLLVSDMKELVILRPQRYLIYSLAVPGKEITRLFSHMYEESSFRNASGHSLID